MTNEKQIMLAERNEKIMAAFREGKGLMEVSRSFGLSKQHIHTIAVSRGFKFERNEKARQRSAAIIQDLKNGIMNSRQLADKYGVPLYVIQHTAYKAGFHFTDRSKVKPRNEQIVRLFLEGKAPKELAVQFGIVSGTVSQILSDNGIKARDILQQRTQLRYQQIIQQFSEGKTKDELAAQFGLHKNSINYIISPKSVKPVAKSSGNKKENVMV